MAFITDIVQRKDVLVLNWLGFDRLLVVMMCFPFLLMGCSSTPRSVQFDYENHALNQYEQDRNELTRLLASSEFDALTSQLRVMAESRLANGRSHLAMVLPAFTQTLEGQDEQAWQQRYQQLDAWSQQISADVVTLVRARVLWRHAWAALKSAPADPDLFRQRLDQAFSLLEPLHSDSYLQAYVVDLRLRIMRDRGDELGDIEVVFWQAQQQWPAFEDFYLTMVTTYWGRNRDAARDVRSFMRQSGQRLSRELAQSLYTQVFASFYPYVGEQLFDGGYAQWDDMNRGYQRLRAHYPHSYALLNEHAYFACRAKDWPRFNELNSQLGPLITPIWVSQNRYQGCLARAGVYAEQHPSWWARIKAFFQ